MAEALPETLQRTPVVMLVFNRPDKTRRVFEAVARARPPKLLVVADGARPDHPEDRQACELTRAVFEDVDWPCEVQVEFSDENLGCQRRILTGLDWAFSQVPEAIVLEDDCLPEPSFFPYCEELLERYRDDPRVHMIRGGNFFEGRTPTPYSYHFTHWYHIWGWASWARAWQCTDHSMRRWPLLRARGDIDRQMPRPFMKDVVRDLFDDAFAGRVTTWEYHFLFGGYANDAWAVCPEQNLVTNIGFGADAAHYKVDEHPHANLPTAPLGFPLRHPPEVAIDDEADVLECRLVYGRHELTPLARRAASKALGLGRRAAEAIHGLGG